MYVQIYSFTNYYYGNIVILGHTMYMYYYRNFEYSLKLWIGCIVNYMDAFAIHHGGNAKAVSTALFFILQLYITFKIRIRITG